MTGAPVLTYKQLQDEVLSWAADPDNAGRLRNLVKLSMSAAHAKILGGGPWLFMQFPIPQRLSITAGQRLYSLHEAFAQMRNIRSLGARRPVEEQPSQNQVWDKPPEDGDTVAYIKRFQLAGELPFKAQSAVADVLTATSSNPADNGRTVTVWGETATGVEEETLTLPNAGSTTFLANGLLKVRKNGTGWLGTLSVVSGSHTTVLTLPAASYGKIYRQLFTVDFPGQADTVEYNFYRQPTLLSDDNDIPDLPPPFSRILVYETLLDLQGFMRSTNVEVKRWDDIRQQLQIDMEARYQEGLSEGAEPAYVTFVPR